MSAENRGQSDLKAAARDFHLYLSLSQELLKFISREDIDEFLALGRQRTELVARMRENPATETYRKTAEAQSLVQEIKPLDMQLIYKAKAWLNKSRRKTAAVHAYDLRNLQPLGTIFNKKY